LFLARVYAAQLVNPLLVGTWQVLPEESELVYEIAADGQCVRYVRGQAQPGICEFTASDGQCVPYVQVQPGICDFDSWYQLTTPDGTENGTYVLKDADFMILINPRGQREWKRVASSAAGMRPRSDADPRRLGSMGQIPGNVLSASPTQLVVVTDRDRSIYLKKGEELEFVVNSETQVQADAPISLTADTIPRDSYVTVTYERRGGQLLATRVHVWSTGNRTVDSPTASVPPRPQQVPESPRHFTGLATAESPITAGDAAFQAQNYEAAVAHYTAAIELKPNNALAYYKRGHAYRGMGERQKALLDFKQALELSNDAALRTAAAACLRQDPSCAVEPNPRSFAATGEQPTAKQAPAADPYEEGMRLYDAKQDQAAIAYFTQAITAQPRRAEAFVGRGMARYALGQYAQAIEDFSTAIELRPAYEDAYLYRGKAYRALRQPERANGDFTTATQVNPASGKGYFERANTYQMFNFNQPATALKDLDEAIRREPQNAFYYNRRGGLLFETNNFERAIADFDRAVALDATLAQAYGNRGLAKYWLNHKSEAAEDFRQCLILAPSLQSWLEQQVNLIPAIQQWQADFWQWYSEIQRDAAKSRDDYCSGKYGQTGARVANCRSHGVNDTEEKIQKGGL
jgi:tetratricopeptide (TPR) repeat protein